MNGAACVRFMFGKTSSLQSSSCETTEFGMRQSDRPVTRGTSISMTGASLITKPMNLLNNRSVKLLVCIQSHDDDDDDDDDSEWCLV